MSGENRRKIDTLAKLFQAVRSRIVLTRLSDNLLKLEHHARLKQLSRYITRSRHSKYSFALSPH